MPSQRKAYFSRSADLPWPPPPIPVHQALNSASTRPSRARIVGRRAAPPSRLYALHPLLRRIASRGGRGAAGLYFIASNVEIVDIPPVTDQLRLPPFLTIRLLDREAPRPADNASGRICVRRLKGLRPRPFDLSKARTPSASAREDSAARQSANIHSCSRGNHGQIQSPKHHHLPDLVLVTSAIAATIALSSISTDAIGRRYAAEGTAGTRLSMGGMLCRP